MIWDMSKILLSGVKPTGRPHIGNYFGMMKRCVDMQNDYKSFIFIPDLHALNSVQNKEEMNDLILTVLFDYLAIGVDPKTSVIFKQSDVPAHAELTWIFDTITTMPYLMRAHAFKDAEAKNKEISVGTFNYPMLMAADILLYDTDVVPVGQDQKQHVEFARDTAQKFNNIFGETFKLPEPFVLKEVAVVPGIDGRKMSKSYGNGIELFAEDNEIRDRVAKIVTDSSGGIPENVYAIHLLFRPKSELDTLYEENKGRYKELKEILANDIIAFITPMRERRKAIVTDKQVALDILREAGEKARGIAEKKMEEVREKVGLKLY